MSCYFMFVDIGPSIMHICHAHHYRCDIGGYMHCPNRKNSHKKWNTKTTDKQRTGKNKSGSHAFLFKSIDGSKTNTISKVIDLIKWQCPQSTMNSIFIFDWRAFHCRGTRQSIKACVMIWYDRMDKIIISISTVFACDIQIERMIKKNYQCYSGGLRFLSNLILAPKSWSQAYSERTHRSAKLLSCEWAWWQQIELDYKS